MTFAFSKDTVRKAISAHSAVGLICCALLYLICATGTAIVLYEEWQRFEQLDAPEMNEIDPASVQRGIENVLASEQGGPNTTHLYVHLPTKDLPRTTITTDTQAVHIDRQGDIVVPEENAWAEFLLALHYRLNLPAVFGMTLVGLFGAMIVALTVSGLVAHPRIFRDAFRLRARRADDVATLDWHNRLAVWTLPFALAISLTGAMIGLFYVSGSALAAAAYGGDSAAALAPVFGDEPEEDTAPASTPDIVPALAFMEREYPDIEPYYVILHDPGTAGQHIQIVGEHPRRLIFGEYYAFSADGAFRGTVGLADGTVGQQLSASTYNLPASEDRVYRVRPRAHHRGGDGHLHLARQARAAWEGVDPPTRGVVGAGGWRPGGNGGHADRPDRDRERGAIRADFLDRLPRRGCNLAVPGNAKPARPRRGIAFTRGVNPDQAIARRRGLLVPPLPISDLSSWHLWVACWAGCP